MQCGSDPSCGSTYVYRGCSDQGSAANLGHHPYRGALAARDEYYERPTGPVSSTGRRARPEGEGTHPARCGKSRFPNEEAAGCRATKLGAKPREHEAELRQPGVQSLFVRLDGARGFRRRPVLRLRKRQAWPFLSDREPSTKAAAIGSLVSSLCRAGGKSRDGRLRKGEPVDAKPAGLSKRHPGEF